MASACQGTKMVDHLIKIGLSKQANSFMSPLRGHMGGARQRMAKLRRIRGDIKPEEKFLEGGGNVPQLALGPRPAVEYSTELSQIVGKNKKYVILSRTSISNSPFYGYTRLILI